MITVAYPQPESDAEAVERSTEDSSAGSLPAERATAVASVDSESGLQAADYADVFFRAAFDLTPKEVDAAEEHQVVTSVAPSGERSTPAHHARQLAASNLETGSHAAQLAAVEADVAATQAKIDQFEDTPATLGAKDDDEPWFSECYVNADDFIAAFHEIFPELHPIAGNVRRHEVFIPPIVVTSGIAKSNEDLAQSSEIGTPEEAERRRRGPAIPTRVAAALLKWVENDPAYRTARAFAEQQRLRYVATINVAGPDSYRIASARDDFLASVALVDDYYLATLQVLAHTILRCGQYGAFACGSYWCPHCRKRFGARLLDDTQAQLRQRYGDDLERARSNLLYGTILCDIVIPTPNIDRDYGSDFAADIASRDHIALVNFLRKYQLDRRSAMSVLLAKRGLSLELVLDWIAVGNRDRTIYDPKNAVADARRLIALNDLIIVAHDRFKSRRKRPDLESTKLISWSDEERTEAYMYQLRKAQKLSRRDILALSDDFQFIDREFRGITKTNYPERLKYKSSIAKVIRRERNKLYRLSKSLPGVSLIGVFELELIDLRHAIGGKHQHDVKAKTLRILATQERKPTKYRKTDEPISAESYIRRHKREFRNTLLDEARRRIAANEDLPEDKFTGIQYAVLLHMHVVIDLNGTPRDDVERWFNGKPMGTRRFKGQWLLPYQVMIKSLYEGKPVDDSLRHISFYAFKGPVAFNYENTAPKRDEELAESDARHYPEQALALAVWLQHSIGHDSLKIEIDWPGVDREKRGPKPKREQTPKMTEEELEEALAELGVELPRDPKGQTDISALFEEAGEGAHATLPPKASRSMGSGADEALDAPDANWTRSVGGEEDGI
ncbi:hypothetical protein [Methylobacterium sp. E-066]|uniref:hypothetical protein n=1 Tax=Methylobacterium sp. E-066 TaxID=2836584 RepID=UPI001FBB7125|nr:hypothetical protein [Methylobacterium sp. E-066]MCJ2144350.1 hypothetical protein [Methylobacterium sp. E-066]